MSVTIYGISNCDTIKKARKWLTEQGVEFTFHDFRKDGLDQAWLSNVESVVGWEVLLNKRGTTFRQLSDEQKSDLNKDKALALLAEHPAMIKRPVLDNNGEFHVGFKPAQYEEIFTI